MGETRPRDRWQTVQAVEFSRVLRVQLAEMNGKVAWMERQSVRASNARACALRTETAKLRREIKQAEFLITRLEEDYLGRDALGPPQKTATRPRQRPAKS